jgi:hypothetical protein
VSPEKERKEDTMIQMRVPHRATEAVLEAAQGAAEVRGSSTRTTPTAKTEDPPEAVWRAGSQGEAPEARAPLAGAVAA